MTGKRYASSSSMAARRSRLLASGSRPSLRDVAVVGLGAGAALVVGGLATKSPAVALLAATVVLTVALPWPVLWGGIGWVMLCRPGVELVHVAIGGFAVSEIDVLVGLSVLAGASIAVREPATRMVRVPWVALLAWPIWFIARALLPDLGAVVAGSPYVDLRLLEAYLLMVPLGVVLRRRPASHLVGLLVGVATAAGVVAIVASVMARAGLLGVGERSVVLISGSAAGDVRPGGELTVAIVGAMAVLGAGWLRSTRRLALICVLAVELYLSKTLSLVLAITSGVLATVATSWRTLRVSARFALVGLSVAAITLLSGAVNLGGRYDVAERVTETSGSYRLAEARTVTNILIQSPLAVAIGTGVGTQFVFADEVINEVKRDTHSVYVSVAAKTGLVGLALMLLPFVSSAIAALRRGGNLGRSVFGGFISVAVISISVPFAWTIPGLAAVLVLFCIARAACHESELEIGEEVRQ